MEIIEVNGIKYNKEIIEGKGECLVPHIWKFGDYIVSKCGKYRGIISIVVGGINGYDTYHLILTKSACNSDTGKSYNGKGYASIEDMMKDLKNYSISN